MSDQTNPTPAAARNRNPNRADCAWCGKKIWRNSSGGTWLHARTASASCWPGSGSWRRANPREVN